MKLFMVFVALNILNVVLQTVEKMCTVKCGKIISSIVSAITFGVYTVVIVYMNADLPLFTKAMIVALCNLIGVFTVKYIQEKTKKDKIWKIEISVDNSNKSEFENNIFKIAYPAFTPIRGEKFTTYCFLSHNQNESIKLKPIIEKYAESYFTTETNAIL